MSLRENVPAVLASARDATSLDAVVNFTDRRRFDASTPSEIH